MQIFHRAFGGLEPRPRKDRQAQVNGGGVERIDGAVEIETERLIYAYIGRAVAINTWAKSA